MDKDITALNGLLKGKKLEPFIKSIRFPTYRNLSENAEITFDFPITAITGQNGCNKSSVLRALFGCPDGYNISSFWFSTNVDPILERSKYIYKVYNPYYNIDTEIIQSRILNPSNPDYWETSRPLKSDGMDKLPEIKEGEDLSESGRNLTRWKKINKNVVYIDFRSEISAFDKAFYHGSLSTTLHGKTKQQRIRDKSVHLRKIIDNNLITYKPFNGRKEKVQNNIVLNQELLGKVCEILEKNYHEVRLIEHKIFDNEGGFSAIIKNGDLSYSEAFAGSGEFAAIMLVYRVMTADPKSLIILDEPEVSLHPGAQVRIMRFLFDMVKKHHHQIIMGTHSPFFIENLPDNAVKTLYLNSLTQKFDVLNETNKCNAFHYLQVSSSRKLTCFVEDALAQNLVSRAIESLGEGTATSVSVEFLPGGVNYLLTAVIPALAFTDRKDVIIFLDGDQKPQFELDGDEFYSLDGINIEELSIPKLKALIKEIFKSDIKPPLDKSNGTELKPEQEKAAYIQLLLFAKYRINYLPEKIPEEFIWKNMIKNHDAELIEASSAEPHDYKQLFRKLTKKSLALPEYKDVESGEILSLQKTCLASVISHKSELLEPISDWINTHLT